MVITQEDILGKLFNNGDQELVYAVEEDTIWGIRYRPGDTEQNRGSWGQNLLGRVIMEARCVAKHYFPLKVTLGQVLVEKEELAFGNSFDDAKITWHADEELVAVKEKCKKEQLQVETQMGTAANNAPQTPR